MSKKFYDFYMWLGVYNEVKTFCTVGWWKKTVA